MRSPAASIAWFFWQRHRLGLSLLAGYGLALSIALRMIPAGRDRELGILFAIPLMLGIPYLISIFTNPDADVVSAETGYPSYMMTLPVRTRDLALWPIALGGGAVAAAWLLFAGLILYPVNANTPVLWPAALLAAMVVVLQALFWTPFPAPYLRVAAAAALVPFLVGVGLYCHVNRLPEWWQLLFFACVIALACPAAVAGLSRARSGGSSSRQPGVPTTQRPNDPATLHSTLNTNTSTLKTPFRAQVWFDLQRSGPLMPLVAAVAMAGLTIPMIRAAGSDGQQLSPESFGALTAIQPGLYLRVIVIALGLPLLLGTLLDCGMRKSDMYKQDLSLNPFLGTRPLSSLRMVLAKLAVSGISVLATWAVVLLFLAGWCFLPARMGAETGTLGGLLWQLATPKALLSLAAVLPLLILWTWRNQMGGLCVDLTGRKWIVQGMPLVVSILATVGLYVGALLMQDPENMRRATELLPTIANVMAGVKLCIGMVAVTGLRRSRIVTDRQLACLFAIWLLIAALIFTSARALLPPGMLTSWETLLAVYLWMPAARLALAPLALEWNRHR